MNRRQVGTSDLSVGEVSLGCWTLGGPSWRQGMSTGWADVDEAEAIAAVHDALDAGVDHFDNADVYGDGKAERLLAKALAGRRGAVTIASKVGHHPGTAEHAFDALHIRHQCEQSLKNLQTDRIDVYYFHHGDFGPQDRYLDEAIDAAQRLREAGKIRLIGLSAYSDADFARLIPRIRPTVLQSWAHLVDDRFIRPGSTVPQLMDEYDMSFVAFSPLYQGLLLGKYDAQRPPQFEPGDIRGQRARFHAESIRDINGRLAKVKERFGDSVEDLARVALQFVVAHDRVACVIPGFRNRAQVACNVAAADQPLSGDDVAWLRDVFAGTVRD